MPERPIDLNMARLALDVDATKIIAITFREPTLASKICKELNLPKVKCYRRIKELEENGLISRETVSPRKNYYRSNVQRICLNISDELLLLTMDFRDGTSGRLQFRLEDMAKDEGLTPQ